MGSHERHVALGEIVEGRTGRQDPAKQLMAALDMGLLPGSHGVAVKDTGAPRAVGSGFDRGGVGEFGAIIRKDDREHGAEVVMTQAVVEEFNPIEDGLSGIGRPEESRTLEEPEPPTTLSI